MKLITLSSAIFVAFTATLQAAPVAYDISQPLWGSQPFLVNGAVWHQGVVNAYAADPSSYDHVTGQVTVDWDAQQLLDYSLSYDLLGETFLHSFATKTPADTAQYESLGGSPFRERVVINSTVKAGPEVTVPTNLFSSPGAADLTDTQFMSGMLFSLTRFPDSGTVLINDIIINNAEFKSEQVYFPFNSFDGLILDGTAGRYVQVGGAVAENFFLSGTEPLFTGAEIAGVSSPVPLPAAGWMLLAGVGAIFGLRRRKAA